MTIKFTKMHGLGNDFMIIDAVNQHVNLSSSHITTLADRHTGVGFDQCLLVETSTEENIDFYYRIFNTNGQESGQCGNGARCLARFVHHYGLTNKTTINIATKTTMMRLKLNDDQSVTVDMGVPQWQPEQIPILKPECSDNYDIPLPDGNICSVHALSVGNPHAVIRIKDVESTAIHELGKAICEHPFFPQQTNVGFMQILSPNHIKLRVYERGCGETRACGSGAVAAAAVGRRFYQLSEKIHVNVPGGELIVDWENQLESIGLTGSANFVYEGELFPCTLSF